MAKAIRNRVVSNINRSDLRYRLSPLLGKNGAKKIEPGQMLEYSREELARLSHSDRLSVLSVLVPIR